MSPEKVKELREKNGPFFLGHCRRLVPERERLLERFDLMILHFKGVVGSKSEQDLLRSQAMEAVTPQVPFQWVLERP